MENVKNFKKCLFLNRATPLTPSSGLNLSESRKFAASLCAWGLAPWYLPNTGGFMAGQDWGHTRMPKLTVGGGYYTNQYVFVFFFLTARNAHHVSTCSECFRLLKLFPGLLRDILSFLAPSKMKLIVLLLILKFKLLFLFDRNSWVFFIKRIN